MLKKNIFLFSISLFMKVCFLPEGRNVLLKLKQRKSLVNSPRKAKPDANRWVDVENSKTISKSQNDIKI